MNEYEYYKKAKEIRIKYQSKLLAELLNLNYQYYGLKKEKVNVFHVFNEIKNNFDFTPEEEKKIIDEGIKNLDNKYNIKLNI